MHNANGKIIEDRMNGDPIHYIHGSGRIWPILEDNVNGLEPGDKKQICISQETGFLEVNEEFICNVVIDWVSLATAKEIEINTNIHDNIEACNFPGCC